MTISKTHKLSLTKRKFVSIDRESPTFSVNCRVRYIIRSYAGSRKLLAPERHPVYRRVFAAWMRKTRVAPSGERGEEAGDARWRVYKRAE